MRGLVAPGMGFEPMGSQGAPVFKTGAVVRLATPALLDISGRTLKPYRVISLLFRENVDRYLLT